MIDFNPLKPPRRTLIDLTRSQVDSGPGLDISVKSAKGWAVKLAPPWVLVWDYKHGRIREQEFTERYIEHIDPLSAPGSLPYVELWHYGLEHNNHINFQCYCSDFKFCHTHVLIDFLVNYCRGFSDGRPPWMVPQY
jgi:uncharacterized protein YeaO (DUF488 family)